jgi:hypothetical protein
MTDDLIDRIIRGDEIAADELMSVYKEADRAGVLYYQMLTMVREQRSLTGLPDTLKEIIKTGAWKQWRWVGSCFKQKSLKEYLTIPPPNGVGIELDTVEKLIADDPEAFALYRAEMVAPKGINQHTKEDNDNISILQPGHGTSLAYTLDRLKRERLDLFEQVKAKQLSANAAAVEAGFRRKPTPFEIIVRQLPRLTAEEREQLINKLLGDSSREGTDFKNSDGWICR